MDTKNLYHEAGQLLDQARGILDANTGKSMAAEDVARYDALMADYDSKVADAERHDRANRAESTLRRPSNDIDAPEGPDGKGATNEFEMKAYRKALAKGVNALDRDERKALRADDDDAGGVFIMPRQQVQGLLKAVDDLAPTRGLATVMQVNSAESLGTVTMETDVSDADWTSELLTGSEDTALAFGDRALHPHKLAKRIKISKKLLRQVPNIEGLVQDRLAYKFAVPQERAFQVGTGVNQPLGMWIASNNGVPTSRDVTAAGAAAITGDDLINVKYFMKPQYWANAKWMLHRDVLKAIRKLKSTDNQYIWQPGLANDQPSTILDVPFVVNEYAPSTITTGLYTVLLADFSFYWIADALEMEVQVLRELYAETGQIGYIGELYTDGMPVLAEAFVRLKQA